ncbi:unnamed protein product [Closterium sp. NIES-64]|nr:unnamed protein product [Closterium sp. NIES-64]
MFAATSGSNIAWSPAPAPGENDRNEQSRQALGGRSVKWQGLKARALQALAAAEIKKVKAAEKCKKAEAVAKRKAARAAAKRERAEAAAKRKTARAVVKAKAVNAAVKGKKAKAPGVLNCVLPNQVTLGSWLSVGREAVGMWGGGSVGRWGREECDFAFNGSLALVPFYLLLTMRPSQPFSDSLLFYNASTRTTAPVIGGTLKHKCRTQRERGHSCPPFDLVNSAGMKLVVRGASPKQQYSGTCFIVEFESLLIKMGLGRNNIAKLTTRDDNPQFPENRSRMDSERAAARKRAPMTLRWAGGSRGAREGEAGGRERREWAWDVKIWEL